jgi:hypothetical protein
LAPGPRQRLIERSTAGQAGKAVLQRQRRKVLFQTFAIADVAHHKDRITPIVDVLDTRCSLGPLEGPITADYSDLNNCCFCSPETRRRIAAVTTERSSS